MKYKYLNYIPKPIHLDSNKYDLVDDDTFIKPDGRIPLLMVTQYGIFPSKNNYNEKPIMEYKTLEMFTNQLVAFIRRGYLSNREYNGIIHLNIDNHFIDNLKNTNTIIDFELWRKTIDVKPIKNY